MKKTSVLYALSTAFFLSAGCSEQSTTGSSKLSTTHVEHTPVKRQAIGNCWLYAGSSWLESLIESSTGETVNVSESYWTYWDFYHKLLNGMKLNKKGELQTGGSWGRATSITDKYGWVAEEDFIPGDGASADAQMSAAQACAESYLVEALGPGGSLVDEASRTAENVKEQLNKAFSCDGRFVLDMDKTYAARHESQDTLLKDPKTGEEKTLSEWLNLWDEVGNPAEDIYSTEGKKLPPLEAMAKFRELENRIKRALNDHQPVALSFYVVFNAADKDGLFNVNTLAEAGELGHGGGHLVILHDYTVTNVPGVGDIGEGDVSDELKEKALEGDLQYVVVKNSWGANREDRPWLKNGYSRLSWGYLTSRYYDEDNELFVPFLRGVAFPPGY